MSTEMPTILSIDVQGFAGRNGEFVVKELAFCAQSEGDVNRYLLQPPYSLSELPTFRRKTATYVTQNIHGLKWGGGELAYDKARGDIISDILSLPAPLMCYCKGNEKARALTDFLKMKVFNVEDIMEETYSRTYYVFIPEKALNCNAHKENKHHLKCAVREAYALRVLLQSFFNPRHTSIQVNCLDVNSFESRVDTFRNLRSCLHGSIIVSYLAKIGYFYNGLHLVCNFCKVAVEDWEENGIVKPHNISHFNRVCPFFQ